MSESCKTCRFWVEGDCRRHAPRDEEYPVGTDADYWCGEYQPLPIAQGVGLELAQLRAENARLRAVVEAPAKESSR